MSTFSTRAAALAVALLPAAAAAAPLTLDEALGLAVQRSEAARAARAGVASAGEASRAAGQLPDPMLRAGIENLPATGPDRFSTTRDFQTMKRIGISQEWLSRDKRAAREAAAQAMVSREATLARNAEAQARLQTALAFLDAWYAGEALRLATQTEHHLHEEYAAATARLSASTGGSAEVLALAASRGMAADESEELRQQESAARLALQRWVGVQPEALAPPVLPEPPAEQAFVESHPAVLALQQEVKVARQAAALAARERQPNWTWELSYGQRTGYSDMLSFGVSIPLPIAPQQRQDRETAGKLALVDKSEAEQSEASREVAAEYRTLSSGAQRLRQRIERYQAAVVAPARQRTAATLAAYRSNQAALAGLFEARHAEVEVQRKLLALQRELARSQAQLAFKSVVER